MRRGGLNWNDQIRIWAPTLPIYFCSTPERWALIANAMSLTARKALALIVLVTAAILGASSFLAFLFFLYLGHLNWVHLGMNETERLLFNVLISAAFFLQHSSMIRRPFRRRLSALIPSHYQGALYTAASSFVLLLSVAFWQGSDIILFEVDGLPGGVVRTAYFLAILGICWGMWALRSIDMFGLGPILKNLQAKPAPSRPFTIRGPYRWVRHPLYLFMIVLFWSCPSLTADRLLFNILWTAWVVIGTILEERDLVDDFGDTYRDYQANVPMLVPRGFLPVCPAGKSDHLV
jgi:protein-S-isoprenylcysteine O-methyltransferase Ste14